MNRCKICGANLYESTTTAIPKEYCWNCSCKIKEYQEGWVRSLPEIMQKESEIIIANAGLIIPFLRCKKSFKLKGKLKRKQFLKLNCKNKQGVIDDFN